ncbi:MAG: HD domain-containing protein [Myxococcales bacterium]|nr:HD domain-containing protein [Myxococcales bacterium]
MSVVAIPTDALKLEEVAGFDLYLQQGERYVLFRSKDYPLDERALEHLRTTGLTTIYVQRAVESSNQVLADRLERTLQDKALSHNRRAETLFKSACGAVRQLARTPDRRGFEEATRVGSLLAAYATGDTWVVFEFFRLAARDAHDFANAAHVAAIATNLARSLGFGFDELTTITTAGLVRDIGLTALSPRLKGVQGKMSSMDRAAVERHVIHSTDLLTKVGADETLRTVVSQHHERIDGGGYPKRLKSDAIHPLARVMGVADAFGTLLTRQGYREPLSPARALDRLRSQESRKFDPEALDALEGLLAQS